MPPTVAWVFSHQLVKSLHSSTGQPDRDSPSLRLSCQVTLGCVKMTHDKMTKPPQRSYRKETNRCTKYEPLGVTQMSDGDGLVRVMVDQREENA